MDLKVIHLKTFTWSAEFIVLEESAPINLQPPNEAASNLALEPHSFDLSLPFSPSVYVYLYLSIFLLPKRIVFPLFSAG